VRHQRASSKEACGNRDPELPGILIAGDDRPGHVSGHAGARIKGDGAPSPLHNDRRAYLGTIIQIDDVIVGHTNAARRHAATKLPSQVGACLTH
jgi:hypothetical protein